MITNILEKLIANTICISPLVIAFIIKRIVEEYKIKSNLKAQERDAIHCLCGCGITFYNTDLYEKHLEISLTNLVNNIKDKKLILRSDNPEPCQRITKILSDFRENRCPMEEVIEMLLGDEK